VLQPGVQGPAAAAGSDADRRTGPDRLADAAAERVGQPHAEPDGDEALTEAVAP
jgi:hypothetical protein